MIEQAWFCPVGIGKYVHFPDLDVEVQVGRMVDLLAPFGTVHDRWVVPERERGAGAAEERLLSWSGGAGDTILYWVGHGWSDGYQAALAHRDSPVRVGSFGVTPEQLADAIRVRQRRLAHLADDEWEGPWALVVIDTCRSRRFAELLVAALKMHDAPRRVMLVGVSGEGATTLGQFTDAFRIALTTTYKARGRIPLIDLAGQFPRLLPGCEVSLLGNLTDADLVPVRPPVASWMSAPLDTIRHLEDVLGDLSPDERRHFLAKAQGSEHGELAWFFEGRRDERARIVSWLRAAPSSALVVSGRAGAGKSALLGDVLVRSLPALREALARRGLLVIRNKEEAPPEDVFDAVIHLSGLTLGQTAARLAAAAGLGPLPSRADPAIGIATDLEWLCDRLAARAGPFTALVDALDEAIDPLDTARSLLARLAGLPGVRVLIGTRASTHETPDGPADDDDLLEILGGDVVWLAREPEAIRRYVRRRLAARDLGRAADTADIERVAALVADRDRQFLFARLAVYEVIEDPSLLLPGRAGSLSTLLEGDHRDLFARALDRLAQLDDRYPVLLAALSMARGRGLPEADGVWAAVAASLPGIATADDAWAAVIENLLERAAAYIVVDIQTTGTSTVYRLAHRTFVEHFARRDDDRERRELAAASLLDVADRIAFVDPGAMPEYLARHLSGHVAEADAWDDLADRPRVLDGLDPDAVTADAVRTLFGRRPFPAPVAGVVGARDVLVRAHERDRPGVRQLATTRYGDCKVIDERVGGWGVAAARLQRMTTHVRLPGHTAAVCMVRALTLPDGRDLVVSCSDDGTLRLWDPETAAPIGAPLTGHTGPVEDLCVVPTRSGIRLASCGGDGTVRLWDPVTARPAGDPLIGHAGRVLSLDTLAGVLISAGADGTIRFWDPAAGWPLGAHLTGHVGQVSAVCALPGPDLLASTGVDGTIRIWDPATRQPAGAPMTGHVGSVARLCALPRDGRTLVASAGADGTVRVWDPVARAQVGEPMTGHTGLVWGVCALPEALLASAGGDGTIRIWDPVAGRQIGAPLTGHDGLIWSVTALLGPLLASAGADGTVRIWDYRTARATAEPAAPAEASRGVCAVPSAPALLASLGEDGTVVSWDPDTGRQIGDHLTGHEGRIYAGCAVPSGDRPLIATGGADGTVRIWDPAAGRQVGPALTGHTGAVWGVGVLPSGNRLVSAGEDGTVRLWDPRRGELIRVLTGHDGRVMGLCALGPARLVSTGVDGTVRIWDPDIGRQIGAPLTGHAGQVPTVTTIPGPRLVTAGDDGTIRLWDPDAGRQIGDPLTGHIGAIPAICAVPAADGRTLIASTGVDGTVRIWDPDAGRQVGAPLTGHAGSAWGLCALVRDGEVLLATSGDDGTVRMWDPHTGGAVGAPLIGSAHAVEALASGVSLTGDGSVHTWDAATAELRPLPSVPHVTAVVEAGETLLTGDAAGRAGDLGRAGRRAVVALCPLPGTPQRVAAAGGDGVGVLPGPLTLHAGPARALCLAEPDLLVSAGNDGAVRRWDTAALRPYGDPLRGHAGWVWSVAAHGNRLASGGADGTVRLWDPRGGDLIRVLTGHTDQVRAVTFVTAADGRTLLVSGGHDGTVRLWRPETGHPVHTIPLGIPVHALHQNAAAVVTAGLRTGIVALYLQDSLFRSETPE